MKKLKALLIACSLLVPSLSLAQATGLSDPISGQWGMNGHALLDLKFDGNGNVTGTVVSGRPDNIAPIKIGTFDAKTGTLKLTGDAKHPDTGAWFHYSIDGSLANGTLSVNAAFGPDKGVFALVKIDPAQAAPKTDIAAALKKNFAEVSGWVTQAAELVPPDKYTYQPTAGVRTFGQLVAHVADAYNYYCAQAAGRSVQWSDPIEKGPTDKAAVLPKLKQAVDACNTATASPVDAGAVIGNIGHTSLHYGNMITYIRMLGLVPPSSR